MGRPGRSPLGRRSPERTAARQGGDPGAEGPLPPRHLPGRAVVLHRDERTRLGQRSGVGGDARRAHRGRVDRERHQGVDDRRARARLDDCPGAHERGCGPTRRAEPGPRRHARAGRGGASDPVPRRDERLQRGRAPRRVRAAHRSRRPRRERLAADRSGAGVRAGRTRSLAVDVPGPRTARPGARRVVGRSRLRRARRCRRRALLGRATAFAVGRARDRPRQRTGGGSRAGEGDGDPLRAGPPRGVAPLRRRRARGRSGVARGAPARHRRPHRTRVHHSRRHDRDPAFRRSEGTTRERSGREPGIPASNAASARSAATRAGQRERSGREPGIPASDAGGAPERSDESGTA